jgi:hypothetical protein
VTKKVVGVFVRFRAPLHLGLSAMAFNYAGFLTSTNQLLTLKVVY